MFTSAQAILLLLLTLSQPPVLVRGTVVDMSGAAVPDATVVLVVGGQEEPVTLAADGTFQVRAGTGVLLVKAAGFAEATHDLQATGTAPIRIVLQPATFADSVVVTADRGATRLPSGASATVVTSAELATSAAGSLDDVLRQTPGFTLFRRASSRTANPTTQGVTLRGVSGSGASRTLVLADGVPLNDPFGSWVYWNRVPIAAIDRVEVVRGGAGDLYGADALGGVVQLLTFSPARSRLRTTFEGGSHDTARVSLFGGTTFRGLSASAAGEWLRTDGVLTIGPESQGTVDTPADSDYRTGFVSIGTHRENWRAAVRVSAYDEHRNNGTVLQVNSTAWRQLSFDLGGVAGGGAWEVHAAGGSQEYFQTFSAVAAIRNTERLTTEQWTPSDFASASGQWTRNLGRHTLLIGAETDRTESTVDEYRYALVSNVNTRSGPFIVGGTSRNSAVYSRIGLAVTDAFTTSVGLRGDFWHTDPLLTTDPSKSESFFSPRLGAAYRAGALSLQAAVYRAYRTPTLNELYRGFRVGNIQTNPNAQLAPERLTGVEVGALWSHAFGSARLTTFVNTLEGAVANFTIGTQGTTILRERRNSDEIRASGVEVETDWRFTSRLTAHAQMTLTSSHYRGSAATPTLQGNRVPQVPRVQFGGAVTWLAPQMLTVSAQLRGSGKQFDDDLNTSAFELPGYGVVDFFVSRPVARALQLFLSVENAFDVEYETGRTPLRTIGWPRTARVGARLALP
jgi:outer membrane receptor protein involved in Fe transport